MAKKTFDLGDTLAAALGNVSESDRAPEQIVLLPLASIDADAKNFYSMDGVEELAANIELIGLLDPLRVRENPDMPGRYLIVSGHRRRAALWTLYESDPEKWAKAPCIVERPAASPELQELRLIYANADTRRMSSADLAKQASRVEELLYKLKTQGLSFPGRMRDQVAAAVKVGATKLAELKVIQKNLIPELRQLWEKGELNHACAYRFAQATELRNEQEIKFAPEWRIDSWLGKLRGVAAICCPDDGAACSNIPERERRAIQKQDPCGSSCCVQCWFSARCVNACEKAKCVAEEKKAVETEREAEREKLRKVAEAERKEKEAGLKAQARSAWERTLRAAASAGVEVRTLAALLQECEETEIEDEELDEMVAWADGTASTDTSPWWDEVDCLTAIADLLHCSADYLLGRTEDPAPAAPAQQTLQFRSGTPDHDCVCWCVFSFGEGEAGCQPAKWQGGKWHFYNINADIDADCIGWIELPDYEGVLKK